MFVINFFSFFAMGILALSQPAPDYGAAGNKPFLNIIDTPCFRPYGFLKPILCFDEILPQAIKLCPYTLTATALTTKTTTIATTAATITKKTIYMAARAELPLPMDTAPCTHWGIYFIKKIVLFEKIFLIDFF